ncbi:hypothetical protein BPO_0876 [Bergeyella porcorum]|uniref:Protein kinase domain-containing protein n=1 Tax=Bergeyella porcorum TaxID=1735111 RepID=A0AAU0F182_9FLAO
MHKNHTIVKKYKNKDKISENYLLSLLKQVKISDFNLF